MQRQGNKVPAFVHSYKSGGEPPLAYRFEVVQGMNLRLGDGGYFVVLYKVLQRVFRTLIECDLLFVSQKRRQNATTGRGA